MLSPNDVVFIEIDDHLCVANIHDFHWDYLYGVAVWNFHQSNQFTRTMCSLHINYFGGTKLGVNEILLNEWDKFENSWSILFYIRQKREKLNKLPPFLNWSGIHGPFWNHIENWNTVPKCLHETNNFSISPKIAPEKNLNFFLQWIQNTEIKDLLK